MCDAVTGIDASEMMMDVDLLPPGVDAQPPGSTDFYALNVVSPCLCTAWVSIDRKEENTSSRAQRICLIGTSQPVDWEG